MVVNLPAMLLMTLLTLFLPGAVWLDLCVARSRRDTLDVFFLRVLLSVLMTSAVALALADTGLFSVPRVLAILTVVSGAGALIARWRGQSLTGTRAAASRDIWWLVPLLGGAALLLARPHEYLYGGWDPSVYLHTATHLHATGGINFHDPLLAAMDPAAREAVLAHKAWPELMSGFRVVDAATGWISPQFQHLYSCWVALFYGVGGWSLALRVNALFALLSVVALYLAGRTLFDRRTGFMAAVLLAGNVVQIWFARFSTAEIVTQYFVWCGVYLLALHLKGERDGSGALSACCFGAAWLTHISAWFVAVPLAAVVVYRGLTGFWRRDLPLALTLAVMATTALLQNHFVSLGYINLIRQIRWVVSMHPAWWGSALLAVAVLIALSRGRSGWLERLLSAPRVRAGLMLMIVGLALYALLLRPRVVADSAADAVLDADGLKRLLSNARSARDLACLVTPLGYAGAVAGAAWLAWRGLTRVRTPVFVILMTVTAAVLYDKQVEPFYMFGARRFLIVVIPTLCLALAYGVSAVWDAPWRCARPVASVVLGVILLVPLAQGWDAIVTRDYEGLATFCRHVADLLPGDRDRRVLLCGDERLAAPLRFIHGEHAFVVHIRKEGQDVPLTRQIRAWQDAGREVFFLGETGLAVTPSWPMVKVGEAHFESVRLERAPRFFPTEHVRHEAAPRLFRLLPVVL